MRNARLDPREIEYCVTLDWNSLMNYFEKKYGMEFKEEIKMRLENAMQKIMAQEEAQKECDREKWK